MTDAPRSVHLYKALVWVIVAIAAVVTWTTSGLDPLPVEDFSSDIALAAVAYEANNDRAEGAPQQQVVNGWYVKDVLPVIAAQNSTIIEHQRLGIWRAQLVPLLLLIFGLGVCADRVGASLIMSRKPRPLGTVTNVVTGPAFPRNIDAGGEHRTTQGPPEPFSAHPSTPTAWTPPSSG